MKLYNQVRYIEDILDLSENEMNTIINYILNILYNKELISEYEYKLGEIISHGFLFKEKNIQVKKLSSTIRIDYNNYIISIYKQDDDYYGVEKRVRFNDSVYYTCDQLLGLKKFLIDETGKLSK